MSVLQTSQTLLIRLFFSFTLAVVISAPAHAREIGVAFIEDGLREPTPRLSNLIFQELRPLLNSDDKLAAFFLKPADSEQQLTASLARANNDPNVDFIIVTGFIGSQRVYPARRFPKPTYLLKVLDPNLTGTPLRDQVRNLRVYSSVNEIVFVFERLKSLFNAKRVGIVLPLAAAGARKTIGTAIATAAKQSDISAEFVTLDFQQALDSQLENLDAVILPPVSTSEQELQSLLEFLQRRKIPSYAVGGDSMVRSGALISDTLDDDERVLARRVALDLQQAISGESQTRGVRLLEPKKRTTINVDTARAIGVDIAIDEIMTARVVQGKRSGLSLSFLSSLELATNRNLDLRAQMLELRVDQESLEQALAARRPQLSAQLSHTRRGEALPEQDSLAGISLSQTIFSPTENAAVDVARLGVNASKKSVEQTQLDTLQQTSRIYFQALQSQAQYDSNLRDLALNRENLLLAQQRKRSGSGTGADIYRWQAIIAASETAVLNAYTTNTSAQHQLAQLLNTRLQIPTTLADVELNQPPFDLLHEGILPFLQSTGQAELLREASAARALARSPQLDIATANIAVFDTQLNALRRSYYTPELAVTAQYSRYLDSSINAAGIELDDQDDWSVSLTATLPLWLGGTRRSLLSQYAAQSELADTQLQSARIALWANSGNVVDNLVANYRAIGLTQQAEEAALKSQQITQSAYKLGAASVTELLDTQNEYREAQDNTHIARYQYLTALVDFQALMGEMPMLDTAADQLQWLQTFRRSMLEGTAQ